MGMQVIFACVVAALVMAVAAESLLARRRDAREPAGEREAGWLLAVEAPAERRHERAAAGRR